MISAFYVGAAALDADDSVMAKTKLSEATRIMPEEPAAWANLGLVQLRLGDLNAAESALKKAADLAPQNAEIEVLRAALERHRGRPAEAIEHLRRAVQLDAGNLKARYLLIQEFKRRDGGRDAAEIRGHIEELLSRQPQNLVLLLLRGEAAIVDEDMSNVAQMLDRLDARASTWTNPAKEQFTELKKAVKADDLRTAKTRLIFLRNLLKPSPAFRQSLALVQTTVGAIADPLRAPLTLPELHISAAPPDQDIRFSLRRLAGIDDEEAGLVIAAWPDAQASPVVFVATANGFRQHHGQKTVLPFPGGPTHVPPSRAGVVALDWNNDFRTDLWLVGAGGIKLLSQTEQGDFRGATADAGLDPSVINDDYYGAWAVDLESDGDLDLVLALRRGALRVLQNNGDQTFQTIATFRGAVGIRDFTWSDLDGDGDPDAAMMDAAGKLHVFANERGGRFEARPAPSDMSSLNAIATGDVNGDNVLDLVVLTADGRLLQVSDRDEGAAWTVVELGRWSRRTDDKVQKRPRRAEVWIADLDNNGAVDLLVSAGTRTAVWLSDGEGAYHRVAHPPELYVTDLADLNDDGRLDVLGIDDDGEAVHGENASAREYHWQVIRLQANRNAGDQRINSTGVGSEVEIRSGLLAQKRVATGRPVHFGLGALTGTDVARIVWPNGGVQTIYDLQPDTQVSARQRLKGSCPFVFADDGTAMRFVTDFLWRSPLGLRINAQDTAGNLQTEDWIKIGHRQLAARDGMYEIRITAELWETHYFDHVSLLAVDHPVGREIFVDERFAHPPPPLAVIVTSPPTPLTRVWDHRGRSLVELTRARDGRSVDTFDLGRYQGVAQPHWITAELGQEVPLKPGLILVANGWVYPTDSSINVAMGQGHHPRPQGIVLEVTDGRGGWRVARSDLGFPAGKNKTVIIDLDGVFVPGAPRRLRLRTNLEVYWDFLAWAVTDETAGVEIKRITAGLAELRYRGFSSMNPPGRRVPDLPEYGRLAGTQQIWRDLTGFHTRFGDVRKLLARVDDRYVIMNAGDELVLRFPAPHKVHADWVRDFVLIGDGWVKDGDYNTAYSKTVLPLPSHDQPEYVVPPGTLEDDPVYRRFPDDWRTFHTRYVTPDRFRRGLIP